MSFCTVDSTRVETPFFEFAEADSRLFGRAVSVSRESEESLCDKTGVDSVSSFFVDASFFVDGVAGDSTLTEGGDFLGGFPPEEAKMAAKAAWEALILLAGVSPVGLSPELGDSSRVSIKAAAFLSATEAGASVEGVAFGNVNDCGVALVGGFGKLTEDGLNRLVLDNGCASELLWVLGSVDGDVFAVPVTGG